MAVNKSYLESLDLETGTQIFVQYGGSARKANLSIDGSEISTSLWLKTTELKALADIINKMLDEMVAEQ